MSKHTPGMWEAQGNVVFSDTVPNGPECGVLVAACGTNNEGIPEQNANARLIAAAPELLRACHSALTLLRGSGFTDNTQAIAELKAAIAKAEGGGQ